MRSWPHYFILWKAALFNKEEFPKLDSYFNEDEAAKLMRISSKTLQTYRREGRGPAYHKIGRRVIYSQAELQIWLDSKRQTSTSQNTFVIGGVQNG